MRFRRPFLLVDDSTDMPHFVLVSDLDHTMVQNEDTSHKALLKFNQEWVCGFGALSLLVFSTGRSPALFSELWVSLRFSTGIIQATQ